MQPGIKIPKIKSEISELSEDPIQIYEVIRIIHGIPLFLEDHLERLKISAFLAGINIQSCKESIEHKIIELISDKKREFGNIKVTLKITANKDLPQCEMDFIPHFYPAEEKYSTGVKIGLMEAERPTPHAKLQNLAIRNKANLMMSKDSIFEVLLVDHKGNITEGSRSNVFFVANNQLFTAPDEKVLNGITRSKIIKSCLTNNVPVIKKDIPLAMLSEFEGAFLTGSSPKVLPISSIGDTQFTPDLGVIKAIIKLYDIEIDQYIMSKLH